ncbi:hypothetical protein ACFFNY_02790 [Paenibacillus hodogayensis]|uniref:Short-chain dehydrogenase n=1 Tax=Paenibacillus hodogayensis TaxID=279208 RepID=A0ABV5VQI1_9BACL
MATYLVWLIVIITAIGFALTLLLSRRVSRNELDRDANATAAKQQLAANPVIVAYVLFPVVIVIGAAILILNS